MNIPSGKRDVSIYGKNHTGALQKKNTFVSAMKKEYQLYLLLIPAMAYIVIFNYIPMYGVQIAFKDFQANLGIQGSEWVGLKHFASFLKSPMFWPLLSNTVGISIYSLILGFPMPIILAIMLNEVSGSGFKKTVQMVTYAPHFISTVVLCGMCIVFLNSDYGMINNVISFFGGGRIDYLNKPEYFKSIYVISSIWQETGWGSVIYFAALAGVDPQVVESAKIDGANKLQKIWHVDIPSIMPTIVILFILRMGSLMNLGFEKAFLLQTPLNLEASNVIATYIYKIGVLGGNFSYTAAIGLFNSVINFVLLIIVNQLVKILNETSLW